MFAPRAHHGFHFPRQAIPVAMAVIAVLAVVLVWAAFMARSTHDDGAVPLATIDAPTLGSVAYSVSFGERDLIYAKAPGEAGRGRLITSFPYFANLHLRGSVSPQGNQIAVLRVDRFGDPAAALSVVDAATGNTRELARGFDYLSPFAWSEDGARLALVSRADGGALDVSEVVLADGEAATVARFTDALQVAPLGYGSDGERLFIVVIDSGGSTLWAASAAGLSPVATLSPGATRDWALSPDGSRLAFVDRLGAGERAYAGKVLTIATGTIRDAGGAGDQLGAVWRPGSPLPDYGGPGGTLQLTDPTSGSYVLPLASAPTGEALVVTVYTPPRDGEPAVETVEVVTADRRVFLGEGQPARFLGWVSDVD